MFLSASFTHPITATITTIFPSSVDESEQESEGWNKCLGREGLRREKMGEEKGI